MLTLYRDGKHLMGTVRGRSAAGKGRGGNDFPLSLEKAD